jgi:hypothetical protein
MTAMYIYIMNGELTQLICADPATTGGKVFCSSRKVTKTRKKFYSNGILKD